VSGGSPVLGRPSPAAAATAALRQAGVAADSAFRADGGDSEYWGLRAASVAGIRHRLAGQPGQDSFAWARAGDRLAVAAADGLGGVPGSDGAAWRAAAAAATGTVASTGEAGARVAAGLRCANEAAGGGGATTLVVALLDPAGNVQLARVGDSTAFVVGAAGATWQELFAPPDEDAVATVTAALPADDPAPETATASLESGEVLVLVTDGLADPWRDGPTTVAPAFAAALAGRPSPLELVQLADFSRQGCHDDRTVVAVWLSPADVSG